MSATVRQTCASACQFDDDDNDEGDQSFECVIAVNGNAAANNGSRLLEMKSNRQVRLSATATNEASATTTVVARMLAVTLSAREILEWSAAAHVVDTDVIASRNVLIDYPRRRISAGATSLLGDPDLSESTL